MKFFSAVALTSAIAIVGFAVYVDVLDIPLGESQTEQIQRLVGDQKLDEDKLMPIVKTEDEWRAQLTEEQFNVTRRKATERAKTGKYWDHQEHGTYRCVCCDLELFHSETKFESGTGWPSFFKPINDEHIKLEEDRKLFWQTRTEVLCRRCDAHLGHVFPDGPAPTNLRYCLNSAALDFEAGDSDTSE